MTNKYAHPWQVSMFKDEAKVNARVVKMVEGYKPYFEMASLLPVYNAIIAGLQTPKPANHGCGGTVISSSYVFTAAHCMVFSFPKSKKELLALFEPHITIPPAIIPNIPVIKNLINIVFQPEEIFLAIGVKDVQQSVRDRLNDPNFFSLEHIHQIIDIKMHPKYKSGLMPGLNTDWMDYDYAILKLKKKLTFSKTGPVAACLPTIQTNQQWADYAGKDAMASGWGVGDQPIK